MKSDEAAKLFDEQITELFEESKTLNKKVADLLMRWYSELKPVMSVMEKHGIYYRNTKFDGETTQGILISKTIEINPRLIVLKNGMVYYVNRKTDEVDSEFPVALVKFVDNMDLDQVKAGFDYVFDLNANFIQNIKETNAKKRQFLENHSQTE